MTIASRTIYITALAYIALAYIALTLSLWTHLASAANHENSSQTQACKSVDKAGNTTYSDCKQSNADRDTTQIDLNPNQNILKLEKPVEAPRNPVVTQRKAAQKQRSSEVEQAKAALNEAKSNYEQAQTIRAGDYLGRKDGGMRPSSQRLERVNAAKAALDEAQNKLDALLK